MGKRKPSGRRPPAPPADDRPSGVDTRPSRPTWDVRLAEPAETVYRELARRAREAESRGDLGNRHRATLRVVDEVLDTIIPHNPIDRRNALAGNLSNIYRYAKGRMRFFWIASSRKRKVFVLHISDTPRKEGDVHDPYEVFSRMVLSGRFKEFFDELGVRLSEAAQGYQASR